MTNFAIFSKIVLQLFIKKFAYAKYAEKINFQELDKQKRCTAYIQIFENSNLDYRQNLVQWMF